MTVNEDKIELEWKERGFSCGLWRDPPGQVWKDYRHDVDELFMLVSGEVELVIDGEQQKPWPGDEVLIPAGAIHTVTNTGKTTNRWLYGYKNLDSEEGS